MRLKISGVVTSIFLFPVLCSSLVTAKEPLGECPPGFKPSTTTKGKYTCTSARPKCGQGYTVKGAHYDTAKKQLIYQCAPMTSASTGLATRTRQTPSDKPREEVAFYYNKIVADAKAALRRSPSRAELRTGIVDPNYRSAVLKAHSTLSRLARTSPSDQSTVVRLAKSMDNAFPDLMQQTVNTGKGKCADKCKEKQEGCLASGKSWLICSLIGAECLIAAAISEDC